MRAEHGRLERLGRRVRWLDRWRRLVAIVITLAIAPFMVLELVGMLGSDWPAFHTTVLAMMLGFGLWCTVEVGLASLTAWWETEHARLGRQRGLPKARVIRRR